MWLTMPTVTASFVAGCLLFGRIRDYLEAERFRGRRIKWLESRGIITRTFTIKGDEADVRHVYRALIAAFED